MKQAIYLHGIGLWLSTATNLPSLLEVGVSAYGTFAIQGSRY